MGSSPITSTNFGRLCEYVLNSGSRPQRPCNGQTMQAAGANPALPANFRSNYHWLPMSEKALKCQRRVTVPDFGGAYVKQRTPAAQFPYPMGGFPLGKHGRLFDFMLAVLPDTVLNAPRSVIHSRSGGLNLSSIFEVPPHFASSS
jgi:hypothetical protein